MDLSSIFVHNPYVHLNSKGIEINSEFAQKNNVRFGFGEMAAGFATATSYYLFANSNQYYSLLSRNNGLAKFVKNTYYPALCLAIFAGLDAVIRICSSGNKSLLGYIGSAFKSNDR